MEYALNRLVQRSNAFQTITAISPLLQMCQALDDISEDLEPDASIDTIVEFIEDSFSRFIQKAYSIFDDAASLIPSEQSPGMLSSILVMFAQQWRYAKSKMTDVGKFAILTEWFCYFVLRLIVIGEPSNAIIALIAGMNINDHSKSEKLSQLQEDVFRWTPPSLARDRNFKQMLPGSRYLSI